VVGRFCLVSGLSGGETGVAGEVIDGGLVGAGGGAGCGVRWRAGACDLGDAGYEEALVEPGEEQGGADARGGDLVAVGAGDALDEAVNARPSEVVGDLPAGDVGAMPSGQGREVGARVAAGEAAGRQLDGAEGRRAGIARAGR